MRKLLFLNSAQRFSDLALLLLRVFVGLFLIWGVWDNITETARMQEFASFLAKYKFPSPEILAPVSVFLQLAVGLGFVLGLFTRWAGIVCVDHFRRGHCHGRPLRRHARHLPFGLPGRHRSLPGDLWRRALLGGCGTWGQ